MDGREAMAFSGGSASFYVHRGGGVGGSGTPPGGFQGAPGFRALSNMRGGGSVGGSTFSAESHRSSFSHCMSIGSSSAPVGGGGVASSSGETVKKKRGRPRKYAPGEGPVSLRLSATANFSPGSSTPAEKRRRGRPPGSGRKQQLASLGEWMNRSAGIAFSPHVITIEPVELSNKHGCFIHHETLKTLILRCTSEHGSSNDSISLFQDIVSKLLSFSQQRPRALCILSGTGTVSSVSLHQPASSTVSVTYEGQFHILCLSGSYLVAEDGGPRSRTGGISVSLSSPDGHVIGGCVATLIAASPVQVVVCSFVYGSSKSKTMEGTSTKGSEPHSSGKLASPMNVPPPIQSYNASATCIWPSDQKSAHLRTGFDLTRG